MPAVTGWRERLRRWRHLWRLRRSGLIDDGWYRASDPSLTADSDPALHYLARGGVQGRDPGPRFSSAAYLAANRDVAAAGLNPLLHYVLTGWAHGRPLRLGVHETPQLPATAALDVADWPYVVLRGLLRRRRVLRPISGLDAGTLFHIEPARGPMPSGWTLVSATSVPANAAATLRVVVGGQVRQAALPGEGEKPALIRLPNVPAQLAVLRTDQPRTGGGTRVVIREIGALEGRLRAVAARRDGLRDLLRGLRDGDLRRLRLDLETPYDPADSTSYTRWVQVYDTPSPSRRAALLARAKALRAGPRISVLVPVYNPTAEALRDMIASVTAQHYPDWELCLADDASSEPHVLPILQQAAAADRRVKLVASPRNGGISAASNAALGLATGAWIALLDHDDMLAPHALLLMAEAIASHPTADLLYSDEDKLDAEGARYDPYFKPDFSPELLFGQNFISHLGVYRASLVRALGGFRSAFDGSQDYDLALRVTARTSGPVVHVPHVLYHWRLFPGATTFSSTQIPKATRAARAAIADAAATAGEAVKVIDNVGNYHRVIHADPAVWPRVTAIVATRDHADVLDVCLRGLLDETDYPALDIVVADNDSVAPETFDLFARIKGRGVSIVACPGPFNYGAINNRAVATAGDAELLLFLNNDISMIEPGWLKEMVRLAVRPVPGAVGEVAAVGAKLLYPDDSVQHAGVVLGMGGVAGHVHLGAACDDAGYFGRLMLTREIGAVTAACVLVRARHFKAVGGFDERNLPVAFNDVDLCLRLREAGLRILWTPHAVLRHWESKSRGSDFTPERFTHFKAEIAYMQGRWGRELAADPFFSANLSLSAREPILAFPPRAARPWDTPARDLAPVKSPRRPAP